MANQRILATEEMVGYGHATKADTLNRHGFIEHLEDGTHQKAMSHLTASRLMKCDASKIPASSAMAETATGEVTNASQPAFLVTNASKQENMADAATLVFGTEIFDQGGDFAANTFTAPVTGRYQLSFIAYLLAIDSGSSVLHIRLITSNRSYYYFISPAVLASDPGYWHIAGSILADMDAADTAYLTFNYTGGAQQVDLEVLSFFSGFLAC